ncbi:MAG: HD-GYP domain-containing protein [Alphaproteobacteria bacterium]
MDSGRVVRQTSLPHLRLSDVLGALSYALDLTEGQPPGHSLRCCWLGMHIGQELGLEPGQLSDLYYTLLLKDTGCSSNAARLWELYGGDERLLKRDVKTVDTQSLFQLGHFVLRHAGPGEPLRKRIRRVLNLARRGEALANEVVRTRCERGADIVRQLGFGDAVAAGVQSLDEHWNGRGRPEGLRGAAIPLNARIALLAQVADVFHSVGGPEAARAEVQRRVDTWFDPLVVSAFLAVAGDAALWAALASGGLDARVAALEPAARVVMVDEDKLDIIAEAFSDVIDAKSNFTYGHGHRVARYSDAIARRLGIPAERRRWLRRGALLHDIGKLGVSNGILDKPASLTGNEWAAVKQHAQLSEEILRRLGVFLDLAPIVGAHHERLDGEGYPRRLAGDAIALETRIITVCDIFDALTAARPYRAAVPVADVLAMMERQRDVALDGRCLEALKACLPQLAPVAAAVPPQALSRVV